MQTEVLVWDEKEIFCHERYNYEMIIAEERTRNNMDLDCLC